MQQNCKSNFFSTKIYFGFLKSESMSDIHPIFLFIFMLFFVLTIYMYTFAPQPICVVPTGVAATVVAVAAPHAPHAPQRGGAVCHKKN